MGPTYVGTAIAAWVAGLPVGDVLPLTYLMEGQEATVLQLPASAAGSTASHRAAYV